jgi:hypothetical protein
MGKIEKALAKRILQRLAGNFYNPPMDAALQSQIAAIKAYNDLLTGYAAANSLGGLGLLFGPSYADILKILSLNPSALKSSSDKNDTKSTSLLQLESEGVPVLVKPTLLENQTAKSDLLQRDYVIDGVDGFDFTQLSDEVEDTVTLQVNGVPVTVNPVLMRPTGIEMAQFGNKMRINLDDLTYLQTKNPVNNPPYNNWSVNQPSPAHNHGMKGNEDLGQRDIIIDGVNYDFVQLNNPVNNPPYNNWSVNQPSPAHNHGMKGNEDLGQRDIIIDGVNYDFLQTKEKGVPVFVNPVLMRPTGVDKMQFGNKMRINLDDLTYMQEEGVPVLVKPTLLENQTAKDDLMQREYVIDGVDGFAFAQTAEEGVPVYVKPKLEKDTMADHKFGNTIDVGGDKVTYADHKKLTQMRGVDPDGDYNTTITVGGTKVSYADKKGAPVTVDPKVMKNTVGEEDFGEKLTVGGDKVSYATQQHSDEAITLQVNGVPVLVDPILMSDSMGAQNMKH